MAQGAFLEGHAARVSFADLNVGNTPTAAFHLPKGFYQIDHNPVLKDRPGTMTLKNATRSSTELTLSVALNQTFTGGRATFQSSGDSYTVTVTENTRNVNILQIG